MLKSCWIRIVTAAVCLLISACEAKPTPSVLPGWSGERSSPEEGSIKFVDSAETNATLDQGIAGLSFVDVEGTSVDLKDFIGEKTLVLVVIRGATGYVCPVCSTQVSRLIRNYPQFEERGAHVVVVYPIQRKGHQAQLDDFLKVTREKLSAAKRELPFPILLDLELKAVNQLGIRKDLSKPATYILDKEGQVRFAYVGSTLSDRPSIKAILEQLDALNQPSG